MTNTPHLLLSLALYAVGVWLLKNRVDQRLPRCGFSLCGAGLVAVTGFFVISDSFTTSGIDESVVYHLRYGLAGAGFEEYRGVMIAGGAALVLAGITFLCSSQTLKAAYPVKSPSRTWSARVMLGMAFLVHPGIQDGYRLFITSIASASDAPLFSELYQTPRFEHAPARPKNLVYIYVESLERTYFDDDLFPGLISGLKELERDSLSFSGLSQAPGTHWTIAGMVASQCGIPLVTASGGNSMSGIDRFLPGATCLGDVLHSKGYALTFMGGADLDFAGKGKFYASHGFSEVLGRRELQGLLEDQGYVNAWGIYDDVLLDQAYQRFEELSQEASPFALFALTLDTHHPRGHLSRRCDGMLYGDGGNPILNAVKCSDHLVSEFVRKITQSPHGANTMVVIGSDHLAMGNTATHLLMRGDRKNLFMVIDPDRKQGSVIDKPGTTLDIAPTLLSLLGYDAPAFGLGRNLLGDGPTLAEQEKDLAQTLAGLRPEISKFWQYPVIRTGIRVDPQGHRLHVEDRMLRLPTLLHVGQNGEIRDVFFAYQLFDYSEKLTSFVVKMDHDDVIVWVDSCSDLNKLDANSEEASFCVYVGKIGDETPFISAVDQELFIPMDKVTRAMDRVSVPTVAHERKLSLSNAEPSQL